mmetsp:Transcript_51594/g.95483  ORF Transcript_51594/g.95483 Transcript_51594/m.95483 type:complete len:217 (+) Transcript_51594:98-748(+)
MQGVIRSSEQRVDRKRKDAQAARLRACRQNIVLVSVAVALVGAFVIINIIMLRSMVVTPLGPDDDGKLTGPLMRERLRQKVKRTESAAAAQLDKLRSRVKKGGNAARAQLDRLKHWVHRDHNFTTLESNQSNATAAPHAAEEGGSSGDRRAQEQVVDQAAVPQAELSLTVEPPPPENPEPKEASALSSNAVEQDSADVELAKETLDRSSVDALEPA